MVWISVPFFPFPFSLYLRSRVKNVRVWWGCVFVKSRLYDDSLETEKTCSVHLTLEASSPQKRNGHLVARQPLGRVEEDFSGSGFFPMWLFFFFWFFFICSVLLWPVIYVLCYLSMRIGKKNMTGVALLKVLIWILFLYPNDVVYFAFSKLNLNDICKNV